MITIRKTLLLVSAVCLVTGVARSEIVDADKAAANWKQHCASCHGPDGKGNTRAGKKAKVEDLTNAEYQKKFTDEKMHKQIKEGMKDDAGKEVMKAYGDKLSDAEIKDLVGLVRTLVKK